MRANYQTSNKNIHVKVQASEEKIHAKVQARENKILENLTSLPIFLNVLIKKV